VTLSGPIARPARSRDESVLLDESSEDPRSSQSLRVGFVQRNPAFIRLDILPRRTITFSPRPAPAPAGPQTELRPNASCGQNAGWPNIGVGLCPYGQWQRISDGWQRRGDEMFEMHKAQKTKGDYQSGPYELTVRSERLRQSDQDGRRFAWFSARGRGPTRKRPCT